MRLRKYLAAGVLGAAALFSGCKPNSSRINQLEQEVLTLRKENQEIKDIIKRLDTRPPKSTATFIPLEDNDSSVSNEDEKPLEKVPEPVEQPSPKRSLLFAQPKGEFGVDGEGTIIVGWRNISSDRASGSEASPRYVADLTGILGYDNLGIEGRLVVNTPTGKRARFFEIYDSLNKEFDVRELHIFYNDDTWGDFKVGKFRLPLGNDNEEEHTPWSESLFETYLNRGGRYDVGIRWDKRWANILETRLAATGGTGGELDTNSAIMVSGDLAVKYRDLLFGLWGRTGRMETTPIKEDAHAIGLFFDLMKSRYRIKGKAGILKQGLRDVNFPDEELVEKGYDEYEARLLSFERDNGGETRTIPGGSIRGDVAVNKDGNLKVFSEFSYIYDKNDPFEKKRHRTTFGVDHVIFDTENCRAYVIAGVSLDNSKSNGRPYLDMEENLDRRNEHKRSVSVNLLFEF